MLRKGSVHMIDPIRKEAIEEMCRHLQGTCDSATYYQHLRGLFPLSREEQDFMDDRIFQCPGCGWWTDALDEVDGLCQDCYEEAMEEEAEDEDDW